MKPKPSDGLNTRRQFIKNAALLAGAGGLFGALPASIQRAFAIDPAHGTTYLEAEHVVILMQENRSFDHSYGTLQGVRGFNDPRAIRLPNKNPVWLQTNARGETYPPFRLNLKETKATWMGSLPHSWTNQVDARNAGKYDRWLDSKRSGEKAYSNLPLTMGYYTRADIPFYYALADAFTICDQHFCSSLTGTMPNRLYLWSGTVRGTLDASAPAKVLNDNVEYEDSAHWMTFPERLEDHGLSWKIYQNELSVGVGFTDEEDAWLANYGDNPLEWFTQYHARFLPAHRAHLDELQVSLPLEIETLKTKLQSLQPADSSFRSTKQKLEKAETALHALPARRAKWSAENFEKLSEREKNLHRKAFCTNTGDPAYHELATLRYPADGVERKMKIPKGDVLHQFRQDVEAGQLPLVSWIVAPENFSDHPSSAWYGAWYLSEVMEILTRNPEVWKKTIFILNYDENDGYFDHVPPFSAPHPHKTESGRVSPGLNVETDFVTLEEELKVKSVKEARESSIGLGYRVPLLIASPWSRGGYVCSQVFDHTSVLQFLERFASHKAGKKIVEANISDWRRTVCGDLTSAFRPFHGEKMPLPPPVPKEAFFEGIHRAQFEKPTAGYRALAREEIEQIAAHRGASPFLPKQEPGVRPSCALPYQLYADAKLNREKAVFEITLAAKNEIFGAPAAGSAFNVYAPGKYRALNQSASAERAWETCRNWAFAVVPGSNVNYEWPVSEFEQESYHLCVHGPNGFFREFRGTRAAPPLEIQCAYQRHGKTLTGNIEFIVTNRDPGKAATIVIEDQAYQTGRRSVKIPSRSRKTIPLDLQASSGWYDFTLQTGDPGSLEWRYAGRVETGKTSITDPAMGNI